MRTFSVRRGRLHSRSRSYTTSFPVTLFFLLVAPPFKPVCGWLDCLMLKVPASWIYFYLEIPAIGHQIHFLVFLPMMVRLRKFLDLWALGQRIRVFLKLMGQTL